MVRCIGALSRKGIQILARLRLGVNLVGIFLERCLTVADVSVWFVLV